LFHVNLSRLSGKTAPWRRARGLKLRGYNIMSHESPICSFAKCGRIGDSWLVNQYPLNFSPCVRRQGGVLPDKRDRFTWNKYFYVDLCAVLTFLIARRRPEALVSILTLFYNLGDIGAVAMLFSTKLADNALTYFLCAHTNFHAQMPACRATVARTVSPQKHCTLGATLHLLVRPSFRFFRFHFLSYNSPISRFCPSGDASYGERPLASAGLHGEDSARSRTYRSYRPCAVN